MQNKEQYFKINTKIYTALNNPKAILIMAYLTSYGKETIEVEQTHLARICGYEGQMPQRYIQPTIQELLREGWIDSYEKVQAKNGYKSVTTKWHLSDKALSLSQTPTIQNKEKEQQEQKKENKENRQTTHKEREQGDAPQGQTPNARNDIKKNIQQPKPIDSERTRFDAIVAARAAYQEKLKEKFTIQNGKNT